MPRKRAHHETPWWVVGYTEGGFPFPAEPPDLDELRPDFLVARDTLAEAFRLAAPGVAIEIGHVDHLADGLSRSAWRAPVTVCPDPDGLSDDWVVLLPTPDVERGYATRVRNEVIALAEVRAAGFPYRVPEVLAAWDDIIVERFVSGVPVTRKSVRAWELTGAVAAAVHRVPTSLPGPATRREHALYELQALRQLPPSLRERAETWALYHLPPELPTGLVHGDLLNQNLRLGLDGPDGVIDWEYVRRGDPAFELAIVTRGVARPFKVDDGLDRLVEAFHAAGGEGVAREHVQLYELTLLAGWFDGDVHDAPQRLQALLRRLGA